MQTSIEYERAPETASGANVAESWLVANCSREQSVPCCCSTSAAEGLADCADIMWPQRAPYHPDCNQTLPRIPHRHNIEAPYLQYCTYCLPMNDGTEIERRINASETVSLRCLNYLTKAYCLVRWYQVRTKYMLAKIHTILPCELDHPSSIKMSAMLTNSPASVSAWLTKTNGYGTVST